MFSSQQGKESFQLAVEILIVREFSVLQVIYAAAGIGLIAVGGRSGWRSVSV